MDDNRNANTGQGAPEGSGYGTPGQDSVIQSNDPDIASPSKTAGQRLTTPASRIQSLNEQPGDSNPALRETIAEEQGQMSTADMLNARETAEEQRLRDAQAQIYQDEGPDQINREFSRTDSGAPDLPYNYQESATGRSLDSPDVQQDFESITGGIGGQDLRARAESMMDRDGTETAYTDAMHGEGPFGDEARRLDISGPETTNTFVPGDNIVKDMRNIPDEG